MTSEDFTSHPTLQIQVHRPLTWWRATSEQISGRLQDPDRGNIPRWPSYDQDWKAIGTAVNAVAHEVAAGRYSVDPNHENTGLVHIPDRGIGVAEKKIVQAWFGSAEGVTSDPWSDGWSDGRHRTWHTAQANPGIALPVRGDSIGYANTYDIPHLGSNWEKMYQQDLERLSAMKWFDLSDPLNAQFTRSLQIAAMGKVPPAVQEARHSQARISPELEALRKHMAASSPQAAPALFQQPSHPDPWPAEHTRPQSQQARLPQNKDFDR